MQTRVPFSPVIVGAMRLGSWGAGFDTKQYRTFIEQCVEMGATTFDHADIYGHFTTEEEFGNALKEAPGLRDKIQIITKCGIRFQSENRPENRIKSYDSSKEYIIESVEKSLKALGTDHIDVLLIHRPDFLMDPDEISEAVQILNEQDKIIDFGVSNFSPAQFDLMNDKVALCTNQVEVSLGQRKAFTDGTIDQCHRYRLPIMAWSPLGGGRFFSENPDAETERILLAAKPLCEKYECSLDQLLLAFLNAHPTGILPVIGTSKSQRVWAAMEAMKIKLEREDWYILWEAAEGKEVA